MFPAGLVALTPRAGRLSLVVSGGRQVRHRRLIDLHATLAYEPTCKPTYSSTGENNLQ